VSGESQAAAITCSACGHAAPAAEFVQREEIRADVWQVVMVCPVCGARRHVYYMTDELRAERQKLHSVLDAYQAVKDAAGWNRYQTARDVFKRQFDKTQARWARKLGVDHAVEL